MSTSNVFSINMIARAARVLNSFRGAIPFAAILCTFAMPAFSIGILVPNGNFTTAADDGVVGGGLIASSGSSIIGSGPWSGTYNAVAGLLVPPGLAVSDSPSGGTATIGHLLAANVLGSLFDTGGYFSQTIPTTPYLANSVYTLTADVDAANPLTALVLNNVGVGIALTGTSGVLASTTDGTHLLGISLLSGTDYQVQLSFTTGATAPSGNIGIRLFDLPSGLAQAALLQSVTFSNVSLDVSAQGGSAAPEPGAFTQTGMGLMGVAAFVGWMRKRKQGQADVDMTAAE